jgi:type IV pilus assembly protein PilA
MKKNTKGFTLVEIMIVVVIIGLLAAMAIPAFQKVRQNSQEKAVINNLRQVAAAADQYFLETGNTVVADITADLVGDYIKSLEAVAQEDYSDLDNTITAGFTSLSISVPGLGAAVTYGD